MKQTPDHQPMLQALRIALDAAKAAGHTIDEFAHNVTANLAESAKHPVIPMIDPNQQEVSRDEIELVVPRAQPNELLKGWRGRVSANNCKEGGRDIEALLLAWTLKKSSEASDNPDFVECAAFALGVTRQELIRRHTLTPYFDSLANLRPNKPGRPGRHLQTYQRHAAFRIDGKKAMFCHQCAVEDLGSRPYSYWRRSHHLPGVVCCSTHEIPLMVAGDHTCFDHCPDHYLNNFNRECVLPQDEAAKGMLLRYARIAEEILERAPTIDSTVASSLFRERAKKAGLRFAKVGSQKTLSTHLMDLLPSEWLEETFPRIKWQRDKYIPTIDGACVPRLERYTASTLCMLAALFYDDVDHAFAELVSSPSTKREPFLGFDFWASREVFDLYCAHEGNVSRVADAIGLPVSTVSFGLLNQGLPGLGRSVPLRTALRTLFTSQSIEASCQAAGVSKEALVALLLAGSARLAKALDRMPDADLGRESSEDAAGRLGSAEQESFGQVAEPE